MQYEGDVTPRCQRIRRSPEARQAAINHARQFGEQTIHGYELDREEHDEEVDPDFRAPTPRDVKGPAVDP